VGTFFPPQLPKYGKNNNVYKNCCNNVAIIWGIFLQFQKIGRKLRENFPPICERLGENNRKIFYSNYERLGENNRKIISSNLRRLGENNKE
jgi:hypothetical protein